MDEVTKRLNSILEMVYNYNAFKLEPSGGKAILYKDIEFAAGTALNALEKLKEAEELVKWIKDGLDNDIIVTGPMESEINKFLSSLNGGGE
jgi:hypothetical protein